MAPSILHRQNANLPTLVNITRLTEALVRYKLLFLFLSLLQYSLHCMPSNLVGIDRYNITHISIQHETVWLTIIVYLNDFMIILDPRIVSLSYFIFSVILYILCTFYSYVKWSYTKLLLNDTFNRVQREYRAISFLVNPCDS